MVVCTGVGLHVRWSIDQREDERPGRRYLNDITALDVLSQQIGRASCRERVYSSV